MELFRPVYLSGILQVVFPERYTGEDDMELNTLLVELQMWERVRLETFLGNLLININCCELFTLFSK